MVAASLDNFSPNVLRLTAALGGLALLLMSVGVLVNGRLGFPSDDVNERFSFATTLSDEHGPGRILFASTERDLVPGEARPGPGFWYRVLDGNGTTQDEVWLPPQGRGADQLVGALADITSGGDLRPGNGLAPFAIDWVVLDGPNFVLDDVFLAQLDLVPIPLDPESRVFENGGALPIAGTPENPWAESGTGYSGEATESRVPLAVEFDDDWGPDGSRTGWSVTVDGVAGEADYVASATQTMLPVLSLVALIVALAMIGLGARRG